MYFYAPIIICKLNYVVHKIFMLEMLGIVTKFADDLEHKGRQ